ncbi:MAG TPA: hypothetical protein VK287_08165 [Gaiellaceae bacterium]|nr:hypothetical protein [Gaiellaceae bacterium]
MVDSWRRYKRDLTEAEDRPTRWSAFRPNPVSQRDLLIPVGHNRVKLLAACLFCGFGLSVLWVFFPLLMVSIALDQSLGIWNWAIMGGFAAVAGLAIYLYAATDEQRYWDSF